MPCLTTWYCEGYPVEAAKSRVTCVLYVTRNGDNLQTQMLLKKLESPPPPWCIWQEVIIWVYSSNI